MPSGCNGVIETLIVSNRPHFAVAVTPNEYTLFVFAAATNSRALYWV